MDILDQLILEKELLKITQMQVSKNGNSSDYMKLDKKIVDYYDFFMYGDCEFSKIDFRDVLDIGMLPKKIIEVHKTIFDLGDVKQRNSIKIMDAIYDLAQSADDVSRNTGITKATILYEYDILPLKDLYLRNKIAEAIMHGAQNNNQIFMMKNVSPSVTRRIKKEYFFY